MHVQFKTRVHFIKPISNTIVTHYLFIASKEFVLAGKTYIIIAKWNLVIIIQISSDECQRALSLFNDVLMRSRRALSLYKVYDDSALLVLNGTSLNSVNALLVLSQRYQDILTPIHLCAIRCRIGLRNSFLSVACSLYGTKASVFLVQIRIVEQRFC